MIMRHEEPVGYTLEDLDTNKIELAELNSSS
jgi:hypothetical protein